MPQTEGPSAVPTWEDRLAPRGRPAAPSIMRQNWRSLLFLHWEVPPEVLRPLIPAQLSIDMFEGRAFAGVTPFVVRGSGGGTRPTILKLSQRLMARVVPVA